MVACPAASAQGSRKPSSLRYSIPCSARSSVSSVHAICTQGYYAQPEDFNCTTPKEPTVNSVRERTWNVHNRSAKGDWTKYMPWRAPGSSIPIDPCGVATGFTAMGDHKRGKGPFGPSHYPNGAHGSTALKPHKGTAPVKWQRCAFLERPQYLVVLALVTFKWHRKDRPLIYVSDVQWVHSASIVGAICRPRRRISVSLVQEEHYDCHGGVLSADSP